MRGMVNRRALHALVEELSDDDVVPAKRFLEYLRFRGRDPLRTLLDSAPLDDEPLTEEELVAVREGLAEEARGEVVSQEEVERLFLEPR